MTEITRVHLENEMDLILSHKQTMKLAELCGLGLSTQTTLATAVSELGRSVLECGADGDLILLVSEKGAAEKILTIRVATKAGSGFDDRCGGYQLARRLAPGIRISGDATTTVAELTHRTAAGIRIDDVVTDRWRRLLNSDPEVSPYEEIKRKNRQLQELANRLGDSEQQYRDLTDSLPLIICTLNADGQLLFGNKWLLDYGGQSIEQLNASRAKEFFHPDDWDGVVENTAKLASGTYETDRTYRIRQHTGQYRWHMGRLSPVLDARGEPLYWSLFLADIHAQKEMEIMLRDNQELRETKRLLEEKIEALAVTNKQLEQFAYVASHDLQEPLRKVMQFSDYLNTRYADALPEGAQSMLTRIHQATGRMQTLVRDVLAYATVSDKEAVREPVDLTTVLDETLQELDLRIAETGARIESGPLPVVDGVAALLKQLLINLLHNSLKYSAPGRPVHIRIDSTVADDVLTLQVADNGIGFENRYVPKMFALFQRLHARDVYSGTGIGLAICQKIAEMHGGTITAVGTVGEGAVFTVQLPVRKRDRSPAGDNAASGVAGAPEAG